MLSFFFSIPEVNISMCHLTLFLIIFWLGSSTLPRATSRGTETEIGRGVESKVAAATSSTSIYDNVTSGNQSGQTTAQGVYLYIKI